MKRTAAILGLLALALGVIILSGCAGEDRAAAERAAAEANQTRAEAEAYQQRQAADTNAAAERAAIREGERAASFQMVTSLLPWAALFLGFFGVAGLGLLFWWDLRARQPMASAAQPQALALPPVNVFVLQPGDSGRRVDQWRELQAEAERQGLASGRGEVVIYDDRRRP